MGWRWRRARRGSAPLPLTTPRIHRQWNAATPAPVDEADPAPSPTTRNGPADAALANDRTASDGARRDPAQPTDAPAANPPAAITPAASEDVVTDQPSGPPGPAADTVSPLAGAHAVAKELASVPAATAAEANTRSDRQTGGATVVCVANQKGGVGKTTTTVSLAAALAELGVHVLVVDLDPQGNATTGLGLRAEEGDPSTYRVLVDGLPIVDAVLKTGIDHLAVLPSSLDLAGAEVELVPAFSRELRLRRALDDIRDDYDVVLVDCPPSLGLLTINALVAADQVLVPIQCEYYALEGLGQLMRTVQLVGDNLNRHLELGGVVLTMYDARTNLAQQVVDEVRSYFGDRAYETIIPRTVRLSEAPSFGQPITVFDPTSRGARAYQRLAAEVAQRLGLRLPASSGSALDRLLATSRGDETDDVNGGTAIVQEPESLAPAEATPDGEERL